MNNYLELYEGRGKQVVYVNPSVNSEALRTISPPAMLKCYSTSDNRSSVYVVYTDRTSGSVVREAWIHLANTSKNDGGYIKYADVTSSEGGGNEELYNIVGRIVQSVSTLTETGTVETITSYQQAQANLGDDEYVVYADNVEATLQASTGYYVDAADLAEMRLNSATWSDGVDAASKYFRIKSVIGILGLPYQFMPHVDVRYNPETVSLSNDVESTGVTYAEQIIANMPLLLLTPGRPNFMSGYNTEEKKSALAAFFDTLGGSSSNVEDLVSKTGRFYTFEPTAPDYFTYLNPMAHLLARLMEVQDCVLDGYKLDSINWMTYTQNQLTNLVDFATDYMAIPIYLDSETNITENFSNDTTESSLASTVSGLSDAGRELSFLLGYAGAMTDTEWLAQSGTLSNNQVMENLTNSLINASQGNSLFSSLTKQVGAVATGGKLIFPKIWSDSSFSRSYDISIKLRSPDNDPLSLFYNILLPMCFLICLTQPRMYTNNPNAYASPFIIRGSYKGFFNVDAGIISGLSFSKGDEAQWSAMGVPTTVDVSMTLTDLYEAMSITATTSNLQYDTLDNTALMDYLMTMCGINVFKPEIARMIDMWYITNITSRVQDVFSVSLWGNIRSSISNAIVKIYRGS